MPKKTFLSLDLFSKGVAVNSPHEKLNCLQLMEEIVKSGKERLPEPFLEVVKELKGLNKREQGFVGVFVPIQMKDFFLFFNIESRHCFL